MNKGKKIVALVPIKLNSQRLPNKNKLLLGNKPLCFYICESLLKVNNIDEVYVYCSDNEVKKYIPKGIKFLERDKYLDGDTVKGEEIYRAFINEVHSDIYVLAHTTSPFIKTETISNALDKVIKEEYDSALSVKEIQTFAWYNNKPINYKLDDIPRTQDLEPIFVETSGFFIFEKDIFLKNNRRIGYKPYLQVVDQREAIDIDTKEDYDIAAKLL